MVKFYQIASMCCLFHTAGVFAAEADINTNGLITQLTAINCIKANKEVDLAHQQMQDAGTEKALLSSKIHYLEAEIEKRRELIERLDRRHYQENNENYNQLVIRFEELVEERKLTIEEFNSKQQSYVSQFHDVTQLEKQFSSQCMQQVQIEKELYDEVCQYEVISWCKAFSFN